MSAVIIGLIALVIVVSVIVIGASAYLLMQEPTPEPVPIPAEPEPAPTGQVKPVKPVSIDTRPKVKYVRIVKKNKDRTYPTKSDRAWGGLKSRSAIQIAEVVVWSDGKNVAPMGKASQSSTCFKGASKFVIDNNKSGKYGYEKD